MYCSLIISTMSLTMVVTTSLAQQPPIYYPPPTHRSNLDHHLQVPTTTTTTLSQPLPNNQSKDQRKRNQFRETFFNHFNSDAKLREKGVEDGGEVNAPRENYPNLFYNDPVAGLPEESPPMKPSNGSQEWADYQSDYPHVEPSKLEDENYHQSPSEGIWGHEVLTSPQWSHYPKIFRGKKRDRKFRRKKPKTANNGKARIVASSHYELQYILGRKIIFLCVARGRPRPRITWFKDGVELYTHNYFQVHEWEIGRTKLKSKMEIDPATPMDAGYYKCEANNEKGVDQAGFRTKYRIQ